jgi:hypothetical protein
MGQQLAMGLLLMACATSGCTSTGVYSVQHGDPAYVEQGIPFDQSHEQSMPRGTCSSPQVSFTEALATFCGPPELFHDELMHGDPGAIIAPVPKYHPLPTRPVFEPPYYPPPLPPGNEPITPVVPPANDALAQRSTNWRGPRKRFEMLPSSVWTNARLAKTPVQGVTFPPLDPRQVPPQRIAPGSAEPLLR